MNHFRWSCEKQVNGIIELLGSIIEREEHTMAIESAYRQALDPPVEMKFIQTQA